MARRESWLVRNGPVVGPALLLVVIGLFGIGRTSMWGSEEATNWVARLPRAAIFRLLSHEDAVHGLYYLMIHVLFRTIGASVVTMRAPSLIGAACTVALTAVITRRLTGSSATAALAGLIMAITPGVMYYALSGRSYAIDAALALCATLVFLWAIDDKAGRKWLRWVAYAAVLVVAGYMHEMTTLIMASHGVTLAIVRVRRKQATAWATACAGAAILLIPIIVISQRQRHQLAWIRRPGLHDVWNLVTGFFGPSRLAVAAFAILIVVGVARPWPRVQRRLDLRSVALPLFLVPPTLLLIESTIATPLYGGPRYVFYCLSGAIMLAATGAHRIIVTVARASVGRQWIAATVIVACIAIVQLPQQVQLTTPAAYPQDMGGPATLVARDARPGDGGLYLGPKYEMVPLGYPRDYRDVQNLAVAVSPKRSGRFYGILKNVPQIEADMLQHQRIWAIGDFKVARRSTGRDHDELEILRSHFHVILEDRYHRVEVRLYHLDGSSGRRASLSRGS